MAMMEISVVPIGKDVSLSKYVAAAFGEIEKESGIDYQLTPMGTIIVGDLEKLLAIAAKMHRAVLNMGAQRVVTSIKIDDRRDKIATINSKITAVQKALENKD